MLRNFDFTVPPPQGHIKDDVETYVHNIIQMNNHKYSYLYNTFKSRVLSEELVDYVLKYEVNNIVEFNNLIDKLKVYYNNLDDKRKNLDELRLVFDNDELIDKYEKIPTGSYTDDIKKLSFYNDEIFNERNYIYVTLRIKQNKY